MHPLIAPPARRLSVGYLVAGVAIVCSVAACTSASTPTPTPTATLPTNSMAASASPTELASPSAVSFDACELVTKAEAETLAGTPVDPGQAGNPSEPSCTYTAPPTGPLGQVQVFVGAGAKKTLDIDRELQHEFTEVRGIGDEAWEENNAIFFRSGTTWVAIELVRLNDPAENQEPLESLAKIVVVRIAG
jgi:hypothetical protein